MTDKTWSIEVELDEQGVNADDVDTLMELLEGNHAAIGTAPNGNLLIRIMVDASDAHEAFKRGTARVEKTAMVSGFSTTILGVELVTEKELDRRLALGPGEH